MSYISSSAGNLSKKSYSKDLVKGSSPYASEPFSEYIASRIFAKFSGLETIIYYLQPAKNYPSIKTTCGYVSVCEVYPKRLIRFANFMRKYYRPRTDLDVLNIYIKLGLSIEHLCRLYIFDALIGNEDRHWNNIDIMIKEDGSLINGPALDFGASLCYDKHSKDIKFTDKLRIGPNKAKPLFGDHANQVSFLMDKFEPKNLFDFTENDLIKCLEEDCFNAYESMSKERKEKIKEYLVRRYRFFITPFLK